MTDIQTIAQLELDQHIEQQAQQVSPEPKIDFIDIDGFYNFEASVNSQLIAKIWINTSINTAFGSSRSMMSKFITAISSPMPLILLKPLTPTVLFTISPKSPHPLNLLLLNITSEAQL